MGRERWNSWGIHLDSFAGGVTVHGNIHGNVVYNTSDGGLMIQAGKDNRAFNNTFVDNGPRSQVPIASFQSNPAGTEFHHNIVASDGPGSTLIYCGRKTPGSAARGDRNVYWQAGGGEVKVYLPGDEPYAQWFRPLGSWQDLGFDKQSLVADPLFVDAQGDGLRLRPESPAFGVGFEPIGLSTVGPRKP
jgi:parallel beta-helix repeat protein